MARGSVARPGKGMPHFLTSTKSLVFLALIGAVWRLLVGRLLLLAVLHCRHRRLGGRWRTFLLDVPADKGQ